jgi:hypothetical protein
VFHLDTSVFQRKEYQMIHISNTVTMPEALKTRMITQMYGQ